MNRPIAAGVLGLLGLNAGLALAHVLEWPNKSGLDAVTWLAVQRDLYDGWGAWIGRIDVALVVLLGVAVARSGRGARRWLIASATLLLAAEAVVFPTMVLPTNRAVDAWVGDAPLPGWGTLRASWESGHAARCALLVLAWLASAKALLPGNLDAVVEGRTTDATPSR